MANPVVSMAVCTCSFGTVPVPLTVNSQRSVIMGGMPAATVMDNRFTTFGMCSNPMNPAVASATAAAMGAPTPAPCAPATTVPWAPGCLTVQVCGKCLLNSTSKLTCSYGGVIQVTVNPNLTVQSP